MIESILKEIGLTDYETKVYLALLELGKSSSGEILKKAELRTGKIYEILNSLKNKGLVSEITESGVKKFSPADPKRVHDYLEEKKKTIEKQEKDFELIVPVLMKKINSIKQEVNVEVFYGMKGLKTALQKEIDYAKKSGFTYIVGVGGRQKYDKQIYDFFVLNHQPKRVQAKIKIKKIIGEDARKARKEDQEPDAEIKYLEFVSPVTYNITNGLVIISIFMKDSPLIITLESKDVADSFKQQFELMWKIAKK